MFKLVESLRWWPSALSTGLSPGLAALAVNQRRKISEAGWFSEAFVVLVRLPTEQLLGLGVEEDDLPVGIGEQHGLVHLGQQRG